jgi:fluoroacetyl-CoA thioesterase
MALSDLKLGEWIEANRVVDLSMAASHLGSGSLKVYATPAMVTFIEHTCRQLVEPHLGPGQTSVGIRLAVKHLAPTPMGATVTIRAEVAGVEGNLVVFAAQVRDDVELIGEAEHTRAIIDVDRFLKRVALKADQA